MRMSVVVVDGSAQLVGGVHDVLYKFRVSGVSREDEEESVAQFTCYQCM